MRRFKKQNQIEQAEDVNNNDVISHIEEISGAIAKEVFEGYQSVLLKKDKTYLVDAIWGSATSGDLDDLQVEIFSTVFPKVKQLLDRILDPDQDALASALIRYLVKAYLVMKLYYMIEAFKNVKQIPMTAGIPNLDGHQKAIVSPN